MNIKSLLDGEENNNNKLKVESINKTIQGRVCHDRISILPVLMNLHGNVKTYVEIGTLHGGSLSLVTSEERGDSLFIGIDLFEYTNFGEESRKIDPKGFLVDKQIAFKNIKKFNKNNRIELIKGDSRAEDTILKLKNILNNREIDFLFIDGLHTKDGVIKDFTNYKDLVSPGGFIVFDDYDDHTGVRKGVDEIANSNTAEFHIIGNFDNEFLIIKKEN